jgi:hypothetical protein
MFTVIAVCCSDVSYCESGFIVLYSLDVGDRSETASGSGL